MRILSPAFHGILDYLSVLLLALAPSLFGLGETGSLVSYILAAVHLMLTIATAYPAGLVSVIPFRLHGIIEFIVGAALVISTFIISFEADNASIAFFRYFGLFVLLVFIITEYRLEKVS